MRKDINHIDINNFHQVIEVINNCDLTAPSIPDFIPIQDGLWHCPSTLESTNTLQSSVYCVDFETIKDTKRLVMGSAWDILNQKWWVFISEPETNPRVQTVGNCVFIAHRSTFELCYFKNSYDLDCNIRFLCTHTMAANRYHPAQINLYRSQPYLPMFKQSNDLSLADMALKLLGIVVDKNPVDVFIKAQDETWRESKFQINPKLERVLYKQWLVSGGVIDWKEIDKAEKEFIKASKSLLPKIKSSKKEKDWFNLDKLVVYHQPKPPLPFEEYLKTISPTGENNEEIINQLSTKTAKDAKWVWRFTPTIEELLKYNYTDVKITIQLFANMWPWYSELPYPYITGLYHRSIPFMPLSSDWFDKVKEIDDEYCKRLEEIVSLVNKTEREYVDLVGVNDWDYLDWSVGVRGAKEGKYKWVGETGLSSKKLMRISRLFWDKKPLYVQQEDKLDEDGELLVKKDGESSKALVWYTCDFVDDWITSVKLRRNPIRFDNPNNSTPDFKDTVSVFSKSFLQYWESGRLTSESNCANQVATLYASISFWNSFRDRIINKVCIYNNGLFYVMCLRPLVAGTITNRAIDSIGLVMSKPEKNKVGSEISGYITAPKGYKIIGADFDSIQAVITALYAAIYQAKMEGTVSKPINCLNNEYSKAVINGTKKDKSTVAWLIAKRIRPNWETAWEDEKEADKDYSLGKTAQYALLFGAGLAKLSIACNSESVAKSIISYFKGVFNKATRKYEGGIASGYFNYAQELASGQMFYNGKFYQTDSIETVFLNRPLSNILKPSVRGKDLSMTASNAVTQAVDVDCLCWQVNRIIESFIEAGVWFRYVTTIHDDKKFLIKEEDCNLGVEIFQKCHKEMYISLLTKLNIDLSSFPSESYYYSSVDVNQRYTKKVGDKGVTISNKDGYDYSILANFIHPEENEGCPVFIEDYISSKNLIKYYKEESSRIISVD